MSKDSYIMLVYDIPTSKNEVCPNPSNKLWKHGFRINLSCWVLPKKRLEHSTIVELLAHWESHNIKTHVVEYAESQRDKIKSIARENLEEEIRRQHTSLIECIASADESLKKAQAELEESKTANWHATQKVNAIRDNKIRAIIKKAGESLNAAICCAEAFDETENVTEILSGLRAAIRSQGQAFNATMKSKGGRYAVLPK